jgi:hypothetical protein
MSRHLMAKMRQAAGEPPRGYGPPPKVDWRHGWTLPGRAAEIEHFNADHVESGDPANMVDPNEYSTGILHHGEQRYAIEVAPSADYDDWSWSIHKQVGPDENNPDHWKHMGGIPLGCFCGWGDNDFKGKNDERFFGYEQPDEDDYADKYPTGRENAMIAGEDAFQDHIGAAGSGLGGYDLGDVVRDHGDTKPPGHSLGDEDYGDIFGGRP